MASNNLYAGFTTTKNQLFNGNEKYMQRPSQLIGLGNNQLRQPKQDHEAKATERRLTLPVTDARETFLKRWNRANKNGC